uniref:Putative zinc-binding oxidoreductase n=1 Tax=Triatoma infestans TaxID=30076 RepID=A0A023F1M1_TRIIF
MFAWTVSSFGSLNQLQLSTTVPVPEINHHKDVIVKVRAASVNPIDVAMVGGYGNVLLRSLRQCENFINWNNDSLPFPLILGRDFVGEVVAKGSSVRSDIKIGSLVYGVVPAQQQGCHAEMVVASDTMVRPVPEGVLLTEAASLLYTGLTAWSALCITGDLLWSNRAGKKALVIGGSGGIGTIAIQMLKAWNLHVVTTCRTDAMPLLERLGADVIIDYTAADSMKNLERSGKYDIIFDCATNITHYTYIPFLKDWSNSKYITLSSPLLSNTDKFGLMAGMVKNATEIVRSNIISGAPTRGATIRWAYFLPLETGVNEIHALFTKKKIMPVVNVVYSFHELPEAYARVSEGHNRGKVVIAIDKETSQVP